MAYSDVAALTGDYDFTMRVRACAADEGAADPAEWQSRYQWQMAASPGFGDKYASALAAGVERPGNDQAVISDADVLAAAQAIGGFSE